ncbi:MAG: hypothetical protein ACR2NM_12130 [Bythopirellula sp.]
MNHPLQDQRLAPLQTRRQQKLEFARSRHWQRLPGGTQQACREALARLLCQVITTTHEGSSDQENDDE